MGIFSEMRALIKRRKEIRELRARFRHEFMPEPISPKPSYPPSRFLGDQGVYAHLVQLHVPSEEFETVLKLVGSHFAVSFFTPDGQVDVTNDKGESVRLSAWREFNGTRIELITNSAPLLKLLEEQPVPPPTPWEAFPRINDPGALGSLQGDVEYWWYSYWSPFWESLTDQKRADFLRSVAASEDWIECIERHR